MKIDWMLVATIAAPLLTLFVGAWLSRAVEKRPKLVAYFAHSTAVTLDPGGGNPSFNINTHTVVVRNAGGLPAKNIHIPHLTLPGRNGVPGGYTVWPPQQHQVIDLAGGASEILIPALPPNGELTVSYLYLPPLFSNQIHQQVRHDDGIAASYNVHLVKKPAVWMLVVVCALGGTGFLTLLYLLWEGVARMLT